MAPSTGLCTRQRTRRTACRQAHARAAAFKMWRPVRPLFPARTFVRCLSCDSARKNQKRPCNRVGGLNRRLEIERNAIRLPHAQISASQSPLCHRQQPPILLEGQHLFPALDAISIKSAGGEGHLAVEKAIRFARISAAFCIRRRRLAQPIAGASVVVVWSDQV